jgi:hypothetical protein
MNYSIVLNSPVSEIAVSVFALLAFVAGYVLGRYHGRDKVLRDQHNAKVPRYGNPHSF